ncbi:iron complex transport system substrate-binding protein [Solibacillus kalamii]|uniref:Iron-uptake system-binding protein n=2 Tax=Solibacillus kalamii TaxID=1748298 RepID=A0ABX3ZIF1_9BACL|nr:ABC transporter substrate-binding protein [Solibacillus kalamii]MBM7663828.1 iron complex transport system substrate-binding protein [Solibacillus kalamii]OUZ39460.1 iron-uptake system-binding protein [Solibacillus kalamii]
MKKHRALICAGALALMLAACNTDEEVDTSSAAETEQVSKDEKPVADEAIAQKVSYLGSDYEVPAKVETIIAASLEAMEDAAVLGVKPAGVISTDGTAVPKYLEKDLAGATVVGSKKEPNTEAMLSLNPDVILGTSKWDEAQISNYNKIATTFPYSHISTNWKENLLLFGQLAGKEPEAQKALKDYDTKLASTKESIANSELKDKKVLIIRVRGGLTVYPAGVYLNPSLYEDFGFTVPKELNSIEAQTTITYETLAEWNPDMIFLQFADDENKETPELLQEILDNPIFNSTTAAKTNNVHVNLIDAMAQGGTAWSKINFLDAFNENVLK